MGTSVITRLSGKAANPPAHSNLMNDLNNCCLNVHFHESEQHIVRERHPVGATDASQVALAHTSTLFNILVATGVPELLEGFKRRLAKLLLGQTDNRHVISLLGDPKQGRKNIIFV